MKKCMIKSKGTHLLELQKAHTTGEIVVVVKIVASFGL